MGARVDLQQYKNGVETMTNCYPLFEGGFRSRPGTQFISPIPDESVKGIIIPFIFSTTQAYGVLINEGKMWFYLNKVLLTETVQGIGTIADNGSGAIRVTLTSHGYSNGDFVDLQGIGGTSEALGVWEIESVSTHTFDLVGSTFTNSYTSGGTAGKVVEVTCPFLEADLPNIQYTQDGDVLYITSGSYIAYKLTRTSATSFSLDKFYPNGPYKEVSYQTSATTMTFAGAVSVGTSDTLTASASTFASTDVDRVIKMAGDVNGVQGYLRITAYTSPTQVTATVMSTLSSAAATANWSLGKWNSADGWPRACTFHEQRLLMGGTTTYPQEWWGSFLNAPADFVGDDPTDNSDSYSYTVRGEKINVIEWMTSVDGLLIGTGGEVFKVEGPNDSAIGPASSPRVLKQTTRGSARVNPVIVGDTVLYAHWSKRRIYSLAYDINKDKLGDNDLLILSRHLVGDGQSITYSAYEEQPDSVVWFIRSDGVLLSLVFLLSQQVLGWSKHTTDGSFESVMSIPNVNEGFNNTYVIVKRTVNGATRRYVEVMDRDLNTDSSLEGSFMAATTTVSGLNHLVGESVQVLTDGAVLPSETVDAYGQITLDQSVEQVTSGLAYLPTVRLLEPPQDTTALSTTQLIGRKRKYGNVLIRTYQTKSFNVNGNIMPSRSASDPMDSGPPTPGVEDRQLSELGYKTVHSITITQPNPLPLTVLAVSGTMTIGEK